MMCFAPLLFLFGLRLTGAFENEILCDLVTSDTDERRALEIKAEQFWEPVLNAAQDTKMEEHLAIYYQVEAAIAELPTENQYVANLLSEALMRLKRADNQVFLQAVEAQKVASESLHAGVSGRSESAWSFFTGGQIGSIFSGALKRFAGNGRYSEKLVNHISNRQGDILPALRGASEIAGDVLTDCRLSSKLSFDVMKYDLYHTGVAKTPQKAKDVADRLVAASGETRKHFMSGIVAAVSSITRDVEGKKDDPSATVTRSVLTGMQPLKSWGTGTSATADDEKLIIQADTDIEIGEQLVVDVV